MSRLFSLLLIPIVLAPLVLIDPSYGQGGPPPATVRVDIARLESIQRQRMVTGNIVARRHSRIATQEPGLLIELPVREGEAVTKGQMLAKLDSRRLQITLRQTRQEREVLQATIRERAAELEREQENSEAVRAAFERGAANAKEFRDATADLTTATARLTQTKNQLLVVDARIEFLVQRLEDTEIHAPFAGVVVARSVELGEWVDTGDTILELVAQKQVEAWLNVPQEYLSPVRNSRAPVMMQADPSGLAYPSLEVRLVPTINLKSRTFTLIATLANADGALAPGMSVLGWVPTGDREDLMTVPKNAVLRNDQGPYVFVVQSGETDQPATVALIPLSLEFPLGDRFAVQCDRLHDGDTVVVEGNERLFPTAPIIALPSEKHSTSPTDAHAP